MCRSGLFGIVAFLSSSCFSDDGMGSLSSGDGDDESVQDSEQTPADDDEGGTNDHGESSGDDDDPVGDDDDDAVGDDDDDAVGDDDDDAVGDDDDDDGGTCSDNQQNGNEEGIDCGGRCLPCPQCSGHEDCESELCVHNQCATTQSLPCRNDSPANSVTHPGQVTVNFVDGEWETPAACTWDCLPGFCRADEICTEAPQIQKEEIEFSVDQSLGGWRFGTEVLHGADASSNAGVGQIVEFPNGIVLSEFAIYVNQPLVPEDTDDTVPVVLAIEDAEQGRIATRQVIVPDAFTGGWLWWDIGGVALPPGHYLFKAHMPQAREHRIESSVRLDSLGGYAPGVAWYGKAEDHGDPLTWEPRTNGWDLWFWAVGTRAICSG